MWIYVYFQVNKSFLFLFINNTIHPVLQWTWRRGQGINGKKAMLGLIFSGLFRANWQDNMYIFIVLFLWRIILGCQVGIVTTFSVTLDQKSGTWLDSNSPESFQNIWLEQNPGFLQNCDGRLKAEMIWTDKMKSYNGK